MRLEVMGKRGDLCAAAAACRELEQVLAQLRPALEALQHDAG
jgi:hypothetical protein